MTVSRTEYNRVHKWAERHLIKTRTCYFCASIGKTEWSNIDHEYREDESEWQELCHKCHYAYDDAMFGNKNKNGRPPKRVYGYAWWDSARAVDN
jgi:hypothetical protein